ncbi:uncharacterized protein ACNS7B_023081 [Menidia menidia]
MPVKILLCLILKSRFVTAQYKIKIPALLMSPFAFPHLPPMHRKVALMLSSLVTTSEGRSYTAMAWLSLDITRAFVTTTLPFRVKCLILHKPRMAATPSSCRSHTASLAAVCLTPSCTPRTLTLCSVRWKSHLPGVCSTSPQYITIDFLVLILAPEALQ